MTTGPRAATDRLRSALVLALLVGLATLLAGIMAHDVTATAVGSIMVVMTAAMAMLLHDAKRI